MVWKFFQSKNFSSKKIKIFKTDHLIKCVQVYVCFVCMIHGFNPQRNLFFFWMVRFDRIADVEQKTCLKSVSIVYDRFVDLGTFPSTFDDKQIQSESFR